MKNSQQGFIVPLLIIIAVLVIGGGVYYYSQKTQLTAVSSTPTQIAFHWKKYTSVPDGFSISYDPANFLLHSGYDGKIFDKDTFWLDHGIASVSLIYSGFEHTTIDTDYIGAGIAIAKILPDQKMGCKTVGFGEKDINDTKFYLGIGADRAGSILSRFNYYLVQNNNECFKIKMTIVTDEGSKAPKLTDKNINDLKNLLDKTALTFVFNPTTTGNDTPQAIPTNFNKTGTLIRGDTANSWAISYKEVNNDKSGSKVFLYFTRMSICPNQPIKTVGDICNPASFPNGAYVKVLGVIASTTKEDTVYVSDLSFFEQ